MTARSLGVRVVFVLLLGVFASGAQAATFTVNTQADGHDAIPGDGTCASLGGACTVRAAIEESNLLAGTDAINVPAGTYGLDLGELNVTADVTIDGASAAHTIVDGKLRSRVLEISGSAAVVVSDLRIRHGMTAACGGGVFNDLGATVSLSGVRIDHNRVRTIALGDTANGGGLCNYGTAILSNVHITGNRAFNYVADAAGGGVFNDLGATMTIDSAVIDHNRATGGDGVIYGGGIENLGSLSLNGVTLSWNRAVGDSYVSGAVAADGGGIDSGFTAASLIGTAVTFVGNTAISRGSHASGGGLSLTGSGTASLTGVTARRNSAITRDADSSGEGGGIDVQGINTLTLTDASLVRNRVIGGVGANGGGVNVVNGSTLTMTGGLVSRNSVKATTFIAAPCGGGIAADSATITDTVITLNRVLGIGGSNGGVCGLATLNNVTLAGNVP